VTLELDRSIRRIGTPPQEFWVIEIEAERVKNGEPLRFSLPKPSVKLLEAYLEIWRPKLCTKPSPWLFPAADGGCIDAKTMALAIQTQSRKVLGVAVSPHQFRHISAECHLLDNPDALYTISQHLGHRDPNTTRTYYARPKQRQATRTYQEQVLQRRAQAEIRVSRGRRRFNPRSDVPERLP
jgi:integrase